LLMSKIGFIEWLNAIMKEKGLIPAELSRLSGISESQIGRIRRGEQGLGIDKAVMIARGLGVTPIEVFCRAAGIRQIENDPDFQKLAGYFDRLDNNRRKDLFIIAERFYSDSLKD